jgi:hypothetical protein
MSRIFSIPTALRVFPRDLLGRFFSKLGQCEIAKSCGEKRGGIWHIHEAIIKVTSGQELDAIERHLHSLFDLACDTGLEAIYEAGLRDNPGRELANEIPEEGGVYGKVMWVWLKYPKVIKDAATIHRVDHLTWWRNRNDLPRRPPDSRPITRKKLQDLLSAAIAAEQGRGRHSRWSRRRPRLTSRSSGSS